MNQATAELLIRQYFQSWLQQDVSLFLSMLSPGIRIMDWRKRSAGLITGTHGLKREGSPAGTSWI